MSASAYIVDEVEESRFPYAGHDEVVTVYNVHVTGTADRQKAVAEGSWRTSQEADGEVIDGPSLVGVQGPDDGLDPETWLISHRVTTLRYW